MQLHTYACLYLSWVGYEAGCACSYIQFCPTTSPQLIGIRGFCVYGGSIGVLVCFPVPRSAGKPFLSSAERLGQPCCRPLWLHSLLAWWTLPSSLSPPHLSLLQIWLYQASPYKSLVFSQLADQPSSHFLSWPSPDLHHTHPLPPPPPPPHTHTQAPPSLSLSTYMYLSRSLRLSPSFVGFLATPLAWLYYSCVPLDSTTIQSSIYPNPRHMHHLCSYIRLKQFQATSQPSQSQCIKWTGCPSLVNLNHNCPNFSQLILFQVAGLSQLVLDQKLTSVWPPKPLWTRLNLPTDRLVLTVCPP